MSRKITSRTQRGPWVHRLLILGFGVLLTLLMVWALGHVLSDVVELRRPHYAADRLVELRKEHAALEAQIVDQQEIQEILRTSTDSSQQTMKQLLAIHKLNLERGVVPSELEQQALAESETRFLDNQRRFQEANEIITALSEHQRSIQRKRTPLEEDAKEAQEIHALKVAALKLAVVVPLLFVAAWAVMKKRKSVYKPIIYASFCATFWTTGQVMHQSFPEEYFKYIATGAALVIVLALLVHLIRMAAVPKTEWLLKQYREAYNRNACPICAFPIQRGPFRYLPGLRRAGKHMLPLIQPGESQEDRPYTCPSCGQSLYEPCSQCGGIRHALLRYCEHCGTETEAGATASPAGP